MKKSLVCILLISCLMMALSIPAFAADTGIAPYGTPGSGYDQKSFMFNGQEYTAYFYLQFDTSSYRAKSKCYTEALVDVTHNSLKVQFQTQGSGYEIRQRKDLQFLIKRHIPEMLFIQHPMMWQRELTILEEVPRLMEILTRPLHWAS